MKRLIFTILLVLFSFTINFATTKTAPSGSGTSGDPYLITSLANLSWLAQESASDKFTGKYFVQTVDIDASETAYWDDTDDNSDGDLFNDPNDLTSAGNNDGWLPIGTTAFAFRGIYDGNDKTIDVITFNRASNYVGFFGDCGTAAEIKNLGLTNVNIQGNDRVCALAGQIYKGTITNCYTTGTITGTNYVAGLIGYHYGGTVTKCYSSCNVSGSSATGGLIGFSKGATSTISECYSNGNVSGSGDYVGGFIGRSTSGNVTIENCYSNGSVLRSAGSTKTTIGGFCGQNELSTIQKCYSTGAVTVADGTALTNNGFIGNLSSGTATDNYFDSDASSQATSPGATAKTTTQMKTEATYTGWDFGSTWEIVGGDGANYPRLQRQADPSLPVELTAFTAELKKNVVLLSWATATEVNNFGFQIQKQSSANAKWVDVAFIDGSGNSNSPKQYSYIDTDNVVEVVNYRLKQIDIDGVFEYSNVITVNGSGLAKTELFQNYPNPFNPTTKISFSLSSFSVVKVSVYNSIGEKVADLVNGKMEAGNHSVSFYGDGLSSGVYIYKIETPNYTKSMKMLFMK